MTIPTALAALEELPALEDDFPPHATLAAAYRELHAVARVLGAACLRPSSKEAAALKVDITALLDAEADQCRMPAGDEGRELFQLGYLRAFVASEAPAAMAADIRQRLALVKGRGAHLAAAGLV